MDNQHKKITGYRDLSQEEVDMMNAWKLEEAHLKSMLSEITRQTGLKDWEGNRWVEMARHHLEIGFMFAIKAVARPVGTMGSRS